MKLVENIKSWLRSRNNDQPCSTSSEPLREFVYLDEVSVYSLLASRKGGIPAEFTDSITASLNNEVGGSFNVGLGGLGSKLGAKSQSGQSQSSQVLRKAVIQTSFKELYAYEKDALSLRSPTVQFEGNIALFSDIERNINSLKKGKWIVDIEEIKRGDLLEAKVELETDPLFRMITAIRFLHELMGDRDDLFGGQPSRQVREAYSIAQVLDRLLDGLVPVRGRLTEYDGMKLRGKEILIQKSITHQLGTEIEGNLTPIYIAGVAQNSLFWKDIRQVLFSEAQHNVFCRLAKQGLLENWQPVKAADIFEGVIPEFKEATQKISDIARMVVERPEVTETAARQEEEQGTEIVAEYVRLLEKHHGKDIVPDLTETAILEVVPNAKWYSSFNDRRTVFDEVTNMVDKALNVETPGEVRLSSREKAIKTTLPGATQAMTSLTQGLDTATNDHPHRFLDTEIVAIYW